MISATGAFDGRMIAATPTGSATLFEVLTYRHLGSTARIGCAAATSTLTRTVDPRSRLILIPGS
jgi:hypothetical protein